MNPGPSTRHQKLKYLCRIVGGGTPSKENLEFWKGEIPWVSPKDMGPFRISTTEDHITQEAVEASATSILPRGAVVVVVRSGILRHTLPVGVTAGEFAINQDMKALITRRGLLPEFLAYFIKGNEQRFLAEWGKSGTTVESLDQELMANSLVRIPLETEQTAVLVFLDRETAKIDDLIEKKQRIIELLDEKRAAIVSRAVTQGLDPSVPKKSSGLERLGAIPAHWNVTRLKFAVARIEQGWSPQCETRSAEPDEWGVLKVGCVNGGHFREAENKALPQEMSPDLSLEIKPGDILISRANTRDLLGSAALVESLVGRLLLCDKLYRVRVARTLAAGFLTHLLSSHPVRLQMEREATGTSASMQNIGQDTVRNIRVALPGIAEQIAITEWLSRKRSEIAKTAAALDATIALLREYRSALITAAVTGQLDIREHEKKLEALA